MYNNSDKTKGYSYSNNGENTVGVNTKTTDLTNSGEIINTVFHETTNFDRHTKNEQTALNRGDTAEAIWGLKNFGNENTNKLTKAEWNSLNGNSSILRTGNIDAIINYVNAGNKLGLLNEMTISLPGSTKFITEPPQIDFGPLVTLVSDIISKPFITPTEKPDPNAGKEITLKDDPESKPLITPVPTGDELGTSKPYMELDKKGTQGGTESVQNKSKETTNKPEKVVLGHHPEYVNLADKSGAKKFNIPEKVWERMSQEQRWEANKKFLDRAINRGDEIILATPAKSARPNSYFEKEIQYLSSKGYVTNADGTKMIRR